MKFIYFALLIYSVLILQIDFQESFHLSSETCDQKQQFTVRNSLIQ